MADGKKNGDARAVLVTTAHRGVFFGYEESRPGEKTIILQRARNCVMWDRGLKGFLGLPTTGPTDACRVGPAASRLELMDVTSVSDVSPEAVAAWERAPWAR